MEKNRSVEEDEETVTVVDDVCTAVAAAEPLRIGAVNRSSLKSKSSSATVNSPPFGAA